MKNKQPRVYFGRGGFAGISEIRKSGVGEVRVGMTKQPKVYMGGAGVSPRVVLGSVGIKSGTMVCVNSVKPSEAKPIVQRPAVEKPKESAKAEEPKKPVEEKPAAGTGLTEQEKKAVEFFEKVEAAKAEAEAVKEEAAPNPPANWNEDIGEPTEPSEAVEEAKPAEEPKASEGAAVLPELPLGETEAKPADAAVAGGKRKRRRRKNRKSDAPELGAALSEAFQ